jgi:DNA-binding GntR family transcriptional regulator
MAIQRHSLRDQVRDELAGWLADGRLKPGQRLEEERLARAMGVSRTPLREALASLARDGLVETVPNRGFHVPALSAELVRDLYPIIGSLEALAVRLSGSALRELAAPLEELNSRLAAAHLSPRQRSEVDRRWHNTLVSRNPNRELSSLIERTRRRLLPYDGAWERSMPDVEASRAEHSAIAAMFVEGRAEEAAEAILKHWVRGIRTVTAWVNQRPS